MSTNKDDINFIAKQSITKDKLPKNIFNSLQKHMLSKAKKKHNKNSAKKKIETELSFLNNKVLILFDNKKHDECLQSLDIKKHLIEEKISKLESDLEELSETQNNASYLKDLEDYIFSLRDVDCYHINSKLFFFDSNYNKKYCRNTTSLSGYYRHTKADNINNSYLHQQFLFEEGSGTGSNSVNSNYYLNNHNYNNNCDLQFFNADNIGGYFYSNHGLTNICFNVRPLILNSKYNSKAEDFLSNSKYLKTANTILVKFLKIENKINISGSKPEWLENYSLLS